MATAALILGIVGILTCWFPAALVGTPLAIVGLILGMLARKRALARQAPLGLATAGYVVSIVAVTLGLISTATCSAYVRQARRTLEHAGAPAQRREFDDAVRRALAPIDAGPRP